jgi:hypothetical protein
MSIYYSTSNNAPSNAPVNFYLADDPETLPGPEIDPEPMVIELIEEELPAIVEATHTFEAPEELPTMANIQQPIQMLPPLFPDPPLRHPDPLDKIHQHPFRMFQDPLHHPSSHLYFSNGTLEDPTNGPIHMRDLHLSVRLSNTITDFCLTFLADPQEVNQVCDITLSYMRFTLRQVTRRHEPTLFNPSRVPRDDLQYIRSMIHTLNRSTNLLLQQFTDEQNSLLSFRTPTHFSDLTDNFYDAPPAKPMETRCTVGLIYALRLYYITHHRHTPNGLLPPCALYHQHLYEITREIKSTAAALSLFPARTTFRTMPRFLNHAFLEADLFPLPPDGSLNHRSVNRYRQKAFAQFERATPYVIDFANSFQLDNAECRSVTLRTAQDIVRQAIFEHFLIAQMTRKRLRQQELRNNRVHIGNLPPMDMYLSNFATCFPMITKPSIVQLDLDDVNDCKPLDYHQLFALPPDDGDALVYMDIYSNLATIATDGINFSIDFLPHFEYVLYRVVQLIATNDPTGILPMNYPPTNVVIFQGSPLHANSYMPSSSTRAANPTPRAGIFTINTNHDHLRIIINRNGESFNRVTVQALFQTQHARPLQTHHVGDPDWIPRTAADLRRNFDTDMYHVARDPLRVPFPWLSE